MVLQTEVYNGGYRQQSYSSYQGPTGSYSNFQGVTEYTSPYASSFQVPSHGPHHQSGWSSGGDYYGSGAGYGSGANQLHYPGGGFASPVKPTTHGYGNSYIENSNNHAIPHLQGHGSPNSHGYGSPNLHGHRSPHGQGHGSPNLHGYGSPHGQGHGSPNRHGHDNPHGQGHGGLQNQGHDTSSGFGKTHGLGGAITNQINKLTHGHNSYGNGSPNYGHNPNGFNHGYQHQQPPSWTVKGLDDDE